MTHERTTADDLCAEHDAITHYVPSDPDDALIGVAQLKSDACGHVITLLGPSQGEIVCSTREIAQRLLGAMGFVRDTMIAADESEAAE